MKLYEHKVGPLSHETKHKFLYHLTNAHGYAYTIEQNALKALREKHISTTYDPNTSGVFGHMHCDFKFVMNGKALVEKFGGYSFDHYIRVSGTTESTYESLDEKEIRLGTGKVANFDEYLIGTVLLFKVFSQRSIQWLLYDNEKSDGGIFGTRVDHAPRAIDALYKQMFELKKPVWVGRENRVLSNQEMAFLADAHHLSQSGGDFEAGMRKLCGKYPVTDHWNKNLDTAIVIRRQMAAEIVSRYNAYFVGRKSRDTSKDALETLFRNTIRMLGLGSNAEAILLSAAEENNLYHPIIRAVDWGIIIHELFDGDIEEALTAMRGMKTDRARNIAWYDSKPEFHGENIHVGTRFG